MASLQKAGPSTGHRRSSRTNKIRVQLSSSFVQSNANQPNSTHKKNNKAKEILQLSTAATKPSLVKMSEQESLEVAKKLAAQFAKLDAQSILTNTLRQRRPRNIADIAPPREGANNHLNSMSKEIMEWILSYLDTWEQVRARRVCRLWKLTIEGGLTGQRRYVRLNIALNRPVSSVETSKYVTKRNRRRNDFNLCTGNSHCYSCTKYLNRPIDESNPSHRWDPKPSMRAVQFETNWVEPVNVVPATLTVQERAFTSEMVESFYRIFPQLEILVIYYDLEDTEVHMANLVRLLHDCIRVHSFAFIMSEDIKSELTVPIICELIRLTMPPLKRLDMYVSAHPAHPTIDNLLANHLHLARHLGLVCLSVNRHLPKVGSKNEAFRRMARINDRGLTSLSVQCAAAIDGQTIGRLFELNPELKRVVRLQLSINSTFSPLRAWLVQFENVHTLQLYYNVVSTGTLCQNMIRVLARMPLLTDLTLGDLHLPGGEDRIRRISANQLPNVRKLTLAGYDLEHQFKLRNREPDGSAHVDIKELLATYAYIFPQLDEITLLAGRAIGGTRCLRTKVREIKNVIIQKWKHARRVTVDLAVFRKVEDGKIELYVDQRGFMWRSRENWCCN